MTKIWRKIIAADEVRFSRLHDGRGNVVGILDVMDLPRRLVERVRARDGIFQKTPWWPPKATKAVSRILRPDSVVFEFGSGMSTEWLAQRSHSVVSVESDPAWAKKLGSAGGATVLVRLLEHYFDGLPDGPFDLVIVDGKRRAESVAWALARLRRNGFVYLDNCDVNPDALSILQSGVGTINYLRGYPPAQLAPTE